MWWLSNQWEQFTEKFIGQQGYVTTLAKSYLAGHKECGVSVVNCALVKWAKWRLKANKKSITHALLYLLDVIHIICLLWKLFSLPFPIEAVHRMFWWTVSSQTNLFHRDSVIQSLGSWPIHPGCKRLPVGKGETWSPEWSVHRHHPSWSHAGPFKSSTPIWPHPNRRWRQLHFTISLVTKA